MQEISNNGVRIAYVKKGKGQSVILIHGNGESHELFAELIEHMANDGYTVFAADSRSHGKSDRVKRLRYSDMADDIAELILQEEIEKPILFGFSDGGIVGLLIASKHPDMLKKLIVAGINLSPKGIRPGTRAIMRIGYFFTRSDKIRLMLTQPDIKKEQLSAIQVPTVVFHAEKDIVRISGSEAVAGSVQNGKLQFIKGENHSSYVKDNRKLYELIRQNI